MLYIEYLITYSIEYLIIFIIYFLGQVYRSFGIQSFIENYYAPTLLKPVVRILVVVVFVAWLASSVYVLPYIEVGLDQVGFIKLTFLLAVLYYLGIISLTHFLCNVRKYQCQTILTSWNIYNSLENIYLWDPQCYLFWTIQVNS